MSTEEQTQVEEKSQVEPQDAQMQDAASPPTGPAAMSTAHKKRPRLDLALDSRDRKRGKTMFGLLLGTLNKAKIEDKERNSSEAAKKRHQIEQRLQDKLRKETDSVRRAEEAKKDKTVANRKEEELQLKDSIYKLRRTRLPLLAHFLSTADSIPPEDSAESPDPAADPLAPLPRSHPPPLYYLPAILTPAQEAFLKRRTAEVKEAAEKEWESFRVERSAGIEEISHLRERVAEEEDRKKGDRRESNAEEDVPMGEEDISKESNSTPPVNGEKATEAPPQMEIDEERPSSEKDESKKEPANSSSAGDAPAVSQAGGADEDDAVEY
ncbi:hypothetical protein NM688_g3109 [Phlebia brevispora]|uniref:Uncharacterized protein n=1 Tax=Phlebia brevispora TaxID=194682 RepID=A0ACC1T6U1_9APHY|nr:hypothetical protein NM688_g3109 [Phlebia brevispora]